MTDNNDLSLNPEENNIIEDDSAGNTLDEVTNQQIEDLLEGINGNPERREEIEKQLLEQGGSKTPPEEEDVPLEDDSDILIEAGEAIDWDSMRPELKTDRKRRASKDIFSSLMEDMKAVESGGKPRHDEIVYDVEVEKEKKVIESDELQEELRKQEEMKKKLAEEHGLKYEPSIEEPSSAKPSDQTTDTEEDTSSSVSETDKIPVDQIEAENEEDESFDLPEIEGTSDIDEPITGEKTSSDDDLSHLDEFEFDTESSEVSSDELDSILQTEGSGESEIDFTGAVEQANEKVDSESPIDILPETSIDVDDIFNSDLEAPADHEQDIDKVPGEENGEGIDLEDLDKSLETPDFERAQYSQAKQVPSITSEFDDLEAIGSTSDSPDDLAELDSLELPYSNEFLDEFESIPDMESIEDQPFEEPGDVQVAAPVADYQPKQDSHEDEDIETEEEIEVSEEEIQHILNSLSKLPPGLKYVAEDTIINEKLPYNDLQWLTDKLIHGAPEDEIQDFLEDRGIEVPDEAPVQQIPQTRKRIRKESPDTKGKRKGKVVIRDGKPVFVQEGKSKEKKPIPAAIKFAAAAIILATVGTGLYFFAYEPMMEQERLYEEAIGFVKMGHYDEGIKKYFEAKGSSDLDMEKHKELIRILNEKGDPESLDLATQLAGINDDSSEYFREKYIKNKIDKPGADQVLMKPEIDIQKVKPDPTDKELHYLIADTYIRKAYLASYSGFSTKWNDIDTFFELALEKGYNKLNQTDDEVLDRKAKAFIKWGELLKKKPKSDDYIKRFNEAENIYSKIQSDDTSNPLALYGFLRITIAKGNLNHVKMAYKQIEHHNPSYIDPEALSEYAYLISSEYQNRQEARKILNNVIEQADPPYPKAYYYLGDLYAQSNDLSKSNESYIKGLYAFYYNQTVGVDQFIEQINEEKNPDRRADLQIDETVKAIQKIKSDSNPENSKLQSMIFNNIGENFLKMSRSLRSKVEQERYRKERLIKIARKNFFLAIQKDSNNYKPWKNIGDLYYERNISNIQEFIKQISSSTIQGESSLARLKDKLNRYAKPRKCYEIAVSLTINHGNYKPLTASNLWYQLERGVDENNVDPVLFYKLGYIYFKEKKYKFAKEIWSIIKTDPQYKFNPTLNFSIANAYIRLNQFGEAIRHYENVIRYYKETAERYKNNPDPNSLRQNEVFAKLAKSENNLGVTYHLIGNKTRESRYSDYAILHYYQAREYASKLNNSVFLQAEQLNQDRIFNNILYIKHDNIKLTKRKVYDPILKEKVTLKDPKDYMLIEDIEPTLKKN